MDKNKWWYKHIYPEKGLHTARHQTRIPKRHQRKNFVSHIGTATRTTFRQNKTGIRIPRRYQRKNSHLILTQLPRTMLTHSKAPNTHTRTISTQNFRTSYWHSYPEHNLHTARRQTRMPAKHQRKIFASPISTATPNTIYTQQAAKPAYQHINIKFLYFLLAQLPRTEFTHSKVPNPLST